MPSDNLISKIEEISKPYFPNLSLSEFGQLVERLQPEEPTFAQISQFKGQLQLEIGFCSHGVLVDVTYRAPTWIETLIKLEQIDYLSFKSDPSIAELVCHSAVYAISYSASAEDYRSALRSYWRSLQGRLIR